MLCVFIFSFLCCFPFLPTCFKYACKLEHTLLSLLNDFSIARLATWASFQPLGVTQAFEFLPRLALLLQLYFCLQLIVFHLDISFLFFFHITEFMFCEFQNRLKVF